MANEAIADAKKDILVNASLGTVLISRGNVTQEEISNAIGDEETLSVCELFIKNAPSI